MLPYLLLLSFITIIFGYEPTCYSCKYFIRHNTGKPELGFCRVFKNIIYRQGKEVIIHDFAIHCRNNEDMCGKSGFLYKPINAEKNNDTNAEKNTDIDEDELTDILNEREELTNRCCGEVNEKDEIEQLEKEFFEVFQKIKSYNTKRFYKTSKDLYHLFKKNKKSYE
jgi:hypothetical protein